MNEIGYDEYGQRVYMELGNGVKTGYAYDPYRRWLKGIRTESGGMGNVYQDIGYGFDNVGNVKGYTNRSGGYTTEQEYTYDGLDQLIRVRGEHTSHPYGGKEYYTDYTQEYRFDRVGNMKRKQSKEYVDNTNRPGDNLNYDLEYEYYEGTHRAEKIGTMYYEYDGNGNVAVEREGGHGTAAGAEYPLYREGELYYTDYGFGLVKPGSGAGEDGAYKREYRWNERNQMTESLDGAYSVHYRYGADGERAVKYNATNGKETLYFNQMWQMSNGEAQWLQSKHIYVGETRIGTKYNSEGNANTGAEAERIYYYHSDHLGSAQVITNYAGQLYERLEYTPYGEAWIEWRNPNVKMDGTTPFRFTGKEQDEETGLYYYGARYLDPKTSRWMSGDPALGEYIPGAPVSEEARKRNGNLPGMGGVFNLVNMHVYHYAGNNPVKYTDPDGRAEELSPFTRALIANPLFVHIAQNSGGFEGLFYAAGFVRDANGIYHTRQDALQAKGGYNRFYDMIFDTSTSMQTQSFEFTCEGQKYILWGWKGDYLNLGAGAELGFYKQSPIPGHWSADPGLALPMTMTLKDNNGNLIASYNPSEPQWWITSFNPYYQNIKAGDLIAGYTVDFSKNSRTRKMFNEFYNQWNGRDDRWIFNRDNYTATFNF